MAKRRPWTSGFCALRMPADSHGRCHGGYLELRCSCSCHDVVEVEIGPPVAELVGMFVPRSPEWFAARAVGVSATEIGVILGLSPYDSPFSLYLKKRGEIDPEPDSPRTSLGRHLEPWIAEQWQERHPEFAMHETGTWRSTVRPWQVCNPDRLLTEAGGEITVSALEIKSSGSYDEWGDDGTDQVPLHYRCQLLWQLDVLGLTEGRIACLFLHSRTIREYVIAWHRGDVELMRAKATEFLARLEHDDPPPLDWHKATNTALRQLHPDLVDDEVEVPADWVDAYRAAAAAEAEAKKLKRHAENEIRAALGDAERGLVAGRPAVKRSVFEVKEYVRQASTTDRLYVNKTAKEKTP